MTFSDLLYKCKLILDLFANTGKSIIDFCFTDVVLPSPFNYTITIIELLFGAFLISYLSFKIILAFVK